MDTNSSLIRYNYMLAKARASGTVQDLPRGSCGWKAASQATLKQLGLHKKADKQEKTGKRKSRLREFESLCGPRAEREMKRENIKDALWNACVAFENGKASVSDLLKFGVPMHQIEEWYIQEGIARGIQEIRKLNNG